MKTPYEKIRAGLEEALRWATGDMEATVHRVPRVSDRSGEAIETAKTGSTRRRERGSEGDNAHD